MKVVIRSAPTVIVSMHTNSAFVSQSSPSTKYSNPSCESGIKLNKAKHLVVDLLSKTNPKKSKPSENVADARLSYINYFFADQS